MSYAFNRSPEHDAEATEDYYCDRCGKWSVRPECDCIEDDAPWDEYKDAGGSVESFEKEFRSFKREAAPMETV